MSEQVQEPKRFTARFEHNGVVYIYDYEDLIFDQIEHAKTLFQYHQGLQQRPPKDDDTLYHSGMMNGNAKALAFILNREKPEGGTYEFTIRSARNEALDFVKSLKGKKNFDLLEKVRDDFFDGAGIQDLGLIAQYLPFASAVNAVDSERVAQAATNALSTSNSVKS